MTQHTSFDTPGGHSGPPPTGQVARDQATQVGHSAADAGRHVAGTAAEQTAHVARETRRQAQDLLAQAREQAGEQARNGQRQAVTGLRSLATELHQMADGGDEHGPVSDLAAQAAGRVGDFAEWLDRHEPGDVVDQVRALGRRRPGAFLLGAALAGVIAGRLTRGLVDARRDTGADTTGPTRATGLNGVTGDDTATDRLPVTPAVGPTPGYAASPPLPHEQRGAVIPPPPGPPSPAVYPAPGPGVTSVGEYVDDLRERDGGGPR